MHNVAAVPLPDLKPALLQGRAEPMFDRLAPADLLIEDRYQRGLSPRSIRLIRSIVEGWDWLKFKPPVVALTDRGFEVVDGQHTAIAAACHPEIGTIPVVVVDGTDLPGRASAFVSHAVDRLQATPAQVWHAAVAAGDEDALTVRNVLERAGVTLLPYPPSDGTYRPAETVSLAAVRRLVNKRGAMRAREVLQAMARADLAPITADHIRTAEALLTDPDYAEDFDAERVTAAMRGLGPKIMVEARELALAKRLPLWRALTAVLYRTHAPTRKGRGKAVEAPSAASTPTTAGEAP